MPVPVPASIPLLPFMTSMRVPMRVVNVPVVAFSVNVPLKRYNCETLGDELVLAKFNASDTTAEVLDDVDTANLPAA